MPLILGALGALLMQLARQYLPGIIGRVLLVFGIGLVAHEVGLPALKAFINSKLTNLGPIMFAYFEATGFGIFVTMVLSAYIAMRVQREVNMVWSRNPS